MSENQTALSVVTKVSLYLFTVRTYRWKEKID